MQKIKCPNCISLNTKLINAIRENVKGYTRRYKCLDFGFRFGTLEEWCPDPHTTKTTVKLKARSQKQIRETKKTFDKFA